MSPKHKTLGYFAKDEDVLVKITFEKEKKDLFITNFSLFSFVINNQYIPKNKEDNEMFLSKMQKYGIDEVDLKSYFRRDKYNEHRNDDSFINLLTEIRNSWNKVISNNGEILQATFWKLNICDIIKVEFIKRDECEPRNYNKSKNYIKNYIESQLKDEKYEYKKADK